MLPKRRRTSKGSVTIGEVTLHLLSDGTYKVVAPKEARIMTGSNFPESPNREKGSAGGYLHFEVVSGRDV